MTPPARVAGLAVLLLGAVATAGCTLIHDDEPFRVNVINRHHEEWHGTIRVEETGGGEVRFQRALDVPPRGLTLTLDLQPLVGEFTFIVESGGQVWSAQASVVESKSSWTVEIAAPASICFGFVLDGAASTSCPEPRPS